MVICGSYMFESNVNKAVKNKKKNENSSISSNTYYERTNN